jgi:thioesterase domain-containing protein/acyl carrier protein
MSALRPDARADRAASVHLEQRLVAVWEDVLGIRPVRVTDDFFDLGVDSITAARLFARVERDLGIELPLGAVFRAPTIEALASLLAGGEARPRWTSLVPVQPNGSRPPFFCVHGGAGTILHLQPLVRRLDPDQPFYALQMQGLYGRHAMHTDIEEMAAHYVREVREVQPRGPYHLGGYCFGGIVAYELAQQLRRAGEDVAVVALFNGAGPAYLRRYGSRISRRPQAPRRPELPMQRRVRVLRGRVRRGRVRLHLRLGRPLPDGLRDQYVRWICAVAERAYEPAPYPGAIIQFRGAGLYQEPGLGWTGLPAGGIEDHEVPGQHLDQREMMHEPAVSFVAERLTACLERAARPVPITAEVES